tara:strand:- start:270 stop:416 length:147 start_codon:yes stop_codon:yes gene_type:complete
VDDAMPVAAQAVFVRAQQVDDAVRVVAQDVFVRAAVARKRRRRCGRAE